MRFSEMYPGMHIVRTRELSWARKLSGVVCLVKDAQPSKVCIQMTADCVPYGNVMAVPVEGDDGYWYDVSELIMDANSAILPSSDVDAYSCSVEANYRNFVGCDKLKPFVGNDAVGHVCLIGERQKTGRVVFSKTGYYVVGVDVNGYAAVFQGFCEYQEPTAPRKCTLRVLNLSNTERAFYPANFVIEACRAAFTEDCTLAQGYREDIRRSTASVGVDAGVDDILGPGVNRMELGG